LGFWLFQALPVIMDRFYFQILGPLDLNLKKVVRLPENIIFENNSVKKRNYLLQSITNKIIYNKP